MRRDFAGLEKRRLRAAALFEQGSSQAQVAEDLTVSRQSVSRWYRDWKKSGEGGLKAAGRAGRLSRLSVTQRSELEKALVAGPRAAGYSTELWTLPRVAKLIRHLWGVSYHPGHVWRILRKLGWSCQRPATRAKERNEEAIRQWRRITSPQIKKGRHDTGPH